MSDDRKLPEHTGAGAHPADPRASDAPAAQPRTRDIGGRPSSPELRASDLDRERTAAVLSAALSEGRLDVSEYSERVDALYRARTMGDLSALVADLPITLLSAARPAAASAAAAQAPAAAFFSKVRKTVQAPAPQLTVARSVLGALTLDLGSVDQEAGEITVDARSVLGKLVIVIPENARVEDEGGALFGKWSVPGNDARASGGPVIRIRGKAIFGKVTVWRRGRS